MSIMLFGAIVLSYLVGSIPFGLLLTRAAGGSPMRRRTLLGAGAWSVWCAHRTVRVDRAALKLIPWVPRSEDAHMQEHSLEVQLPFLIRALREFALVPLCVGEAEPEDVARVLEALWGGPETLIVVSSDLSHYLPYQVARTTDQRTAHAILALGPRPIHHEQACGATPINGLILVARRHGLHAELLDLRSSGDTAGRRSEVVGYGAFAFYPREEEVSHAGADQ